MPDLIPLNSFWLLVGAVVIGAVAWFAGRADGRRSHDPDAERERLLDELDESVGTITRQDQTIRRLRRRIRHLRDLLDAREEVGA